MWFAILWSHEWFAHLQRIQQTRFVTNMLTTSDDLIAQFLHKPISFYPQSLLGLLVFQSWESDARSMPRFIQLFVKASIFRMLPECNILRWRWAYLSVSSHDSSSWKKNIHVCVHVAKVLRKERQHGWISYIYIYNIHTYSSYHIISIHIHLGSFWVEIECVVPNPYPVPPTSYATQALGLHCKCWFCHTSNYNHIYICIMVI